MSFSEKSEKMCDHNFFGVFGCILNGYVSQTSKNGNGNNTN